MVTHRLSHATDRGEYWASDDLESRLCDLEARLAEGQRRIDAATAEAVDTPDWEQHWCDRLTAYETVYARLERQQDGGAS